MFIVGVDVGGTFTDLTAVDEATGRVVVTKVPSEPRNEAAALLAGLKGLGIASAEVPPVTVFGKKPMLFSAAGGGTGKTVMVADSEALL